MKLIKHPMYFLASFFIFALIALTSPVSAEETADPAAGVNPEPHQIVATYFHTTARCPTCHKIEELSAEAVSSNFEDELKSGKVVWRVINVDEPANNHYNKDYELYTKSLIISEMKDGKEVRWKNLEKIWVFVRDEEKFDEYVSTEINEWLKE